MIDPMMPSTTVQKSAMCTCITDLAITPEISPIRRYQIRWNIFFPPAFAFGTSWSITQDLANQAPQIIYDGYLQGTGSPPHGSFRRIAA
jgi:hypothetical protein